MKNKTIIYVIAAILIGVVLGKNIYDGYAKELENKTSKQENKEVYLIQYGVYSSNDSMIENTKKLKHYFYYEEEGKFYVLIGVTLDKNLQNKIVDAYKIKSDIYMKKVSINNMVFLETLKQYDNLVENTNDNDAIINAEKHVLSKYDELILRSDSNAN